jgi:pyruvate kinase
MVRDPRDEPTYDVTEDLPDLFELLAEVRWLRRRVAEGADSLLAEWMGDAGAAPSASARNLAAYVALRREDARRLQLSLSELGLSSLGRCEAHVLATLDAVAGVLASAVGEPSPLGGVHRASLAGHREVERNAGALFGQPLAGRHPRIMVTMPAEAADAPELVDALVAAGMDCARINCGHDDPETWERIAASVRVAAARAGRACTVLADLSGPRLRIGDVAPGPAVVRLRPRRDRRGVVVAPAEVLLDGEATVGEPSVRIGTGDRRPARLPVDRAWQAGLAVGDVVTFVDLPGRHRSLAVVAVDGAVARCEVAAGCWIEEGIELWRHRPGADRPGSPPEVTRVGRLPWSRGAVPVSVGDVVVLTGDDLPGIPGRLGADGRVVPARLPIGDARVLDDLEPGHRVLIDGGVVETVVEAVDAGGARLRVVAAPPGGAKIRSEKGLNLPDTALRFPSLTDEDLRALDEVVRFADAVGYSFVRSADDVDRLVAELASRGAPDLAVLLKVETADAVADLPAIIVRAAAFHPVGVMIARGDLAVEIGYQQLAEVQEEILWLAEAAHVPVVWATQVLETLVHTGVPTRAEISDAALAERADCVMLNKGPHLVEGVALLHGLLRRMAPHRHKKTDLLPPLLLAGRHRPA